MLVAVFVAAACPKPAQDNADAQAAASRSSHEASAADVDAGPTLPDAVEILAAHVSAAGGAEHLSTRVKVRSTVSVLDQHLNETSTLWWDAGKFYLEAQMDGVGETRVGYDGTVAWSEDPIYRLRELEGRERAQQIRSADPFLVAHWKDYFDSAQTKGERTVEGQSLYDVELERDGDVVRLSFDVETHLLARAQFELSTPAGPMAFDTTFTDYRPVAGYLVAHKQVSKTPLLTLEQTYTDVTVGESVDPKRLVPPTKLEAVPADPAQAAARTVRPSPKAP